MFNVHSEYTELCAARAEEEQLVSQCGEHTAVSNQLLTVVTVVFIVQYWWYLSNCSKSVHCVGYSLIRSLLSLQGGDEHSTAWHCGKPVASYSSQTSRQVQHLKSWCFGWSHQRFLTYSVTCWSDSLMLLVCLRRDWHRWSKTRLFNSANETAERLAHFWWTRRTSVLGLQCRWYV